MLGTSTRRILQRLWNRLGDDLLPIAEDGVVLAVSGGSDSRALLESVARWQGRHHGRYRVASVDHGTRSTSLQEAQAVVARAKSLGFCAEWVSIKPSACDEASLRYARYDALTTLAHKHSCASIVTAHHADDDVEGFLLHLFGVGGGREGSSMGEQANLGKIRVVRPFLRLSRAELQGALFACGVKDIFWDPADARALSERAFVRHYVIPGLRTIEHRINEKISTYVHDRYEDERLLANVAVEHFWLDRTGTEGRIWIKTAKEPALFIRAMKAAYTQIAPNTDRRSAGKIFRKIAWYLNKLLKEQSTALDQSAISVTLVPPDVSPLATLLGFDLPGARVIVTKDALYLKAK